ncbi:MAG: PhoH family protein [Nanoarchaeota archaeon]
MPEAKYHKIWIPLPDVYDWGGVKAFYELERDEPGQRNLVLVVRSYLAELKRNARADPLNKGMEAVGFLDKKLTGFTANGDLAVLPHMEGLDIGLFTGPRGVEEDDLVSLEKKVNRSLRRDPIFMTGDRTISALLKSRGIKVEAPHWMGGERVVEKGIIIGNNDLLQDLMRGGGSLDLEKAKEYIDFELGPHQGQFIRFLGPNPVYAKVTGDLVFAEKPFSGQSALNSKVIDVRNPRIEVIKREKLHIGRHYLPDGRVLGIKPLDWEQYLALQEGLLTPKVSSMALVGKAGSGKTLLAYAAGIDLVLDYDEENRVKRGLPRDLPGGFFDQMVIFKSTNLVGGEERDLGFLPGGLSEKLGPHLASYEDCHAETVLDRHLTFEDLFCHPHYPTRDYSQRRPELKNLVISGARLPSDRAVIKLVHTAHTRGRSVRRTLIIADEVQNLKPNEVRTITTRLGPESKIVFLGDTRQIDNPSCSHDINGLTYAIQRSLGRPYFRLVKLDKCYRNQVAEDAESW